MTSLHPAAGGLDFVTEIARESNAFAAAAERDLSAPVQHCPGWTVADLVAHLTEVHWFWAAMAADRLSAPPDEDRRPARAEAGDLIPTFRAGARHLVDVLAAADPAASVWTWAPSEQTVGFITRHQVQEAAVHRWDAENAVGEAQPIASAAAVDGIEEFLTFSVASESDHPDQPRPDLDGRLALIASDANASWTMYDGSLPGTVAFSRDATEHLPALTGTASDLLLWLYGRLDASDLGTTSPHGDGAEVSALLARLRALSFTD
jgi:uncharacterized protein (TIGR03083 family)